MRVPLGVGGEEKSWFGLARDWAIDPDQFLSDRYLYWHGSEN